MSQAEVIALNPTEQEIDREEAPRAPTPAEAFADLLQEAAEDADARADRYLTDARVPAGGE